MSSVAAAVLSAIVSLGRSLLGARSLSRESLYVDVDVDVVDVDVVDPPGICASILSWGGARHLQRGGFMFNVWVVLMF